VARAGDGVSFISLSILKKKMDEEVDQQVQAQGFDQRTESCFEGMEGVFNSVKIF
jgi:hypothetical protein